MPTPTCPTCHQPYRKSRAGIWLPPFKTELFDSINAAGEVGLTTKDLLIMHYGRGLRKPVAPETIKSHINQINDMLVETDFVIYYNREKWKGGRHTPENPGRWYVGLRA